MASGSKARVYADVNTHRPREYWDYEAHVIEWGYVYDKTISFCLEVQLRIVDACLLPWPRTWLNTEHSYVISLDSFRWLYSVLLVISGC